MIKSRLRVAGKKVDSRDDVLSSILEIVRREPGLSTAELGQRIGKHKSTVSRYLQELEDSGKLVRSETGRMLDPNPSAEAYKQLETDEFVNSYAKVKEWVERVSATAKPSTVQGYVQKLKAFCDTLKITPNHLLVDRATVERYFTSFKATKGGTSFYGDKIAVRSFCATHGVVFPRGQGGVLAGEKENFGLYADVKLSDRQIERLLDFLEMQCGKHEALFAGLFIETFPRANAGLGIKAEQIEWNSLGGYPYATLSVYESKTQRPFRKLIIHPRVLQLLKDHVSQHPTGYLFRHGDSAVNYYSGVMRSAYAAIGLDVQTEKFGSMINYWRFKPLHALRHCGAHVWLRRTGYNYGIVSTMGWDDISTLKKCYGEMPFEYILSQGVCYNCKPPAVLDETATFDSVRCAIEWLNKHKQLVQVTAQ
jgi:predicted transcriptional regulator